MKENNKYIEEVKKLVEYYQFPSDAPSNFFIGCDLAISVGLYLTRLTDATQPNFSQLEECREFVHFLTICKSSEITMTGKVSINAFGDMKNTMKSVHFNDWHFLTTLQAIASFEADRLERLFNKIDIKKEETLSGNKLLGKHANKLLFYIESYDLGEMTGYKKKSFIYDVMRLAGIMAGNTKAAIIYDEGFTDIVGSQKDKAVTNWLNAYNKHKNKQKD